ncbi:LHFPL tetraspan subfamily member 2a protein-like [Uloborus diversus]|uniref:LHFPL tetraspan subfamily member 2a protein-like n=1 Tax=Uloborus diversus TaxID=327109 RepID=UPI00240A1970|nr:LHFPL tetraspan subfamily member 2a protein-like [Uloborus diversus]
MSKVADCLPSMTSPAFQKSANKSFNGDSLSVRWKTSWSVVFLWTSLSVLVALTCTAGFIETEWLVRENDNTAPHIVLTYDRSSLVYTLGMFSICYRDYPSQTSFRCHRFGVTRFPSAFWQGTCVLYGTGCVLQTCSVLVLLLSLPQSHNVRKIGAQLVSRTHLVAGVLQAAGLLLYPMILESNVGRLHCGAYSRPWTLNKCRLGWAYVASAAGTLLSFYCPFLAHFSFYREYYTDEKPGGIV